MASMRHSFGGDVMRLCHFVNDLLAQSLVIFTLLFSVQGPLLPEPEQSFSRIF